MSERSQSTMITINTNRLAIRNFKASDWEDLYALIIAYEASEFAQYDHAWPSTVEELKAIAAWFAQGDQFLVVCLKVSGHMIGFVGLTPETLEDLPVYNLGYIFSEAYHGQGYASEACCAVLSYAFEQLHAHSVVTGTAAINHASCRLLERLGFQKAGEQITSLRAALDGNPIRFLGYSYAIFSPEQRSL